MYAVMIITPNETYDYPAMTENDYRMLGGFFANIGDVTASLNNGLPVAYVEQKVAPYDKFWLTNIDF